MANHYDVLGVSVDVEQSEIKRAYLKLSRRYHPDITGDVSGHFFKLLTDAYDVLKDEGKRRAYDIELQGNVNDQYEKPTPYTEPTSSYTERSTTSAPQQAPSRSTWRSKDYSAFKERVVIQNPGLYSGMGYIASITFFLIVHLMVVFTTMGNTGLFMLLASVFTLLVLRSLYYVTKFKAGFSDYALRVGLLAITSIGAQFIPATVPLIGYSKSVSWVGISVATASLIGMLFLGKKAVHSLGWWGITRRSYGRAMVIKSKDILSGQIWGTPGNLVDAIDKFGVENIEKGSIGEKKTAMLMEEILLIPGTKIFHGLKFPQSNTADVDHAILNGNRLILIDSKYWTGGDFNWEAYDLIVQKTPGYSNPTNRSSHFTFAVEQYRLQFPTLRVDGYIAIHSNNGTPVTTHNSVNGAGVRMTTPEVMIDEIGQMFSENRNLGAIDRGIMNGLMFYMK